MDYDKHEPVSTTTATQWHPAFFGSLQIEFEQEADKLIFENEHQLGTKPMAIDVLIIKKISTEPVKKNIGRIFRKYNIIEYKSPDDYLSIDDFYKVYGYTCFYKYDSSTVDEIKITDVTITFVSERYPYKLIKHLINTKKYTISKYTAGIYYINGDIIPIQIIVRKRLSQRENLWLSSLTNNLTQKEQAKTLLKSYGKHKENQLYRSVMETITKNNRQLFEKEDDDMCQTLEDIMNKREETIRNSTKNQMNTLTLKLAELGRIDDIIKAAKDNDYQHQLLAEFGL